MPAPTKNDDETTPVNEVRLVGRVGAMPQERELPSGDTLWTFRLNVDRPEGPGQRVDTLDCAVWGGRLKRSVAGWTTGDVVEVSGAIRKRFFRSAAGATTARVEVVAVRGRLIRRAAT